ncbi:MAG TPA: phosphoglucomutase, partial [Cryomorphaceae bacterium]|nr:phosphoglucomutase [Cryomorphaceae bacterium]
HDSRNNSKSFARQVAEVLAANEVQVYLFEDLRPTPELSFSIRHLKCQAGIVITASHNPPEYNGYKVYWEDGGQLVPPHDKGVIEEVRKVRPEEVQFATETDRIHSIGMDVDNAYLEELGRQSLSDAGKKDLKIVFTPIHGTSITLMPTALKNSGFTQLTVIDEQSTPDGDFPTVKSPNPEEAAALNLAVEKAREIGADLVIGTDPDADRVGLAIRTPEGEIELINGNQAASILIYYMLENWQAKGKLNGRQFVAKTIVTTELIDRMAEHYQVACPSVLTGFKWIAEIIRKKEGQSQFIAGGEESYGYMIGDFVRDKDAIASGVMLAEAAAWAKSNGSSLYQMLIEIYHKFGFYLEALVSVTKKGRKGAEEINAMMERFRIAPPTEIGGEKVVRRLDYKSLLNTNLETGGETSIDLPQSNVIQFITDKGSKITARPSGTEPKIKFYFSVHAELDEPDQFKQVKEQLEDRIAKMKASLES